MSHCPKETSSDIIQPEFLLFILLFSPLVILKFWGNCFFRRVFQICNQRWSFFALCVIFVSVSTRGRRCHAGCVWIAAVYANLTEFGIAHREGVVVGRSTTFAWRCDSTNFWGGCVWSVVAEWVYWLIDESIDCQWAPDYLIRARKSQRTRWHFWIHSDERILLAVLR